MTVKTICPPRAAMSFQSSLRLLSKPRLKRLPSIEFAHFSCSVRIVGDGILPNATSARAGEQGADVLAQPLAQVMTRNVVICGQTETVGTIMERMTTGKFRHVPVVEQDQVVGIISIGDVVKHRLHEMEQESAALRDYIQTA